MAGLKCSASTGSVGTGTATTKTIQQVSAPSGCGLVVKKGSKITFDGASPTAGKALVELVKSATGGTGTAMTPAKESGHTGSVQATAKENFTVEPSGGTVISSELVHTQNGTILTRDIVLNPSETLAWRTNVPAAVNARATFEWEE